MAHTNTHITSEDSADRYSRRGRRRQNTRSTPAAGGARAAGSDGTLAALPLFAVCGGHGRAPGYRVECDETSLKVAARPRSWILWRGRPSAEVTTTKGSEKARRFGGDLCRGRRDAVLCVACVPACHRPRHVPLGHVARENIWTGAPNSLRHHSNTIPRSISGIVAARLPPITTNSCQW